MSPNVFQYNVKYCYWVSGSSFSVEATHQSMM